VFCRKEELLECLLVFQKELRCIESKGNTLPMLEGRLTVNGELDRI